MQNNRLKKTCLFLILVLSLCFCGCSTEEILKDSTSQKPDAEVTKNLEDIPEFSDEAYVVIDDNVPEFDEKDLTKKSFEEYSTLDSLGRCGVAYANIGQDIMPTEKRSLSSLSCV